MKKKINTDMICLMIWAVFNLIDMSFFLSVSARIPLEGRPWWRLIPGGGIVLWLDHRNDDRKE